MAAAVAVVEGERDPVAVRAARILVSLRSRNLLQRPEWVPAPAGEAEAAWPAAAPALEAPWRWVRRKRRSPGRLPSCAPWLKSLRELDLAGSIVRDERGAPGSGSPSTSSAGRVARPAVQVLAAPAPAPAKEPMQASSPDTPLDYGAGGSGASSSADDAAAGPRAAKRKGAAAARGSGGAPSAADDEGCSSPAKRARVEANEDKPIPAEPSMQIEARESSGKGLRFDFDLNLPPSDEDDCPGAF